MESAWYCTQVCHDTAGRSSPVSALSWDTYSELLWVGNESGRVSSYHGKGLHRYTSFKAHESNPIQQVRVTQFGVFSLSQTAFQMRDRRGLVRFNVSNEQTKNLRCFTTTMSQGEFLVGGRQDEMLVISSTRGLVTRSITDPRASNISVMRTAPRSIFCGSQSGTVSLLDPRTMKVEHSVLAHTAKLYDFDIAENLLVTCGLSKRQQHLFPDMPKVYDIRMGLQEVASIPYLNDSRFVKMNMTDQSTCLLASQTGQFLVCNVSDITKRIYNTPPMFQHPSGNITAVDFSSSSQSIAFADDQGDIYHYANRSDHCVNFSSDPLILPDPVFRPTVTMRDDSPLSSVGMPYYNEKLLSAWPASYVCEVGHPAPQVDEEVLKNMKMVDFVGYATNPRTTHRNQVQRKKKQAQKKDAPKFRSEQEWELMQSNNQILDGDVPNHNERRVSYIGDLQGADRMGAVMPKHYNRVEIRYSKFGVEDFDFGHYNKTKYGGLETDIPNSYCNSFLQMLYFILPLRKIAKSHIGTDCPKETCLMCELGFLFCMLRDSEGQDRKGQNCQATNFLRAFGAIPLASALQLFEPETPDPHFSYSALIQNFTRFMMERLFQEVKDQDTLESNKSAPIMQQLFGLQTETQTRCAVCNFEKMRNGENFVTDLLCQEKQAPGKSFASLLSASLRHKSNAKVWCMKCGKDQPTAITKLCRSLPGVMLLNLPEEPTMWRQKGTQKITGSLQPNIEPIEKPAYWLPERFGVRLDGADVVIKELSTNEDIPPEFLGPKETSAVYELSSTILQIQADGDTPHLVTQIRAPETPVTDSSAFGNDTSQAPWYLFNDFLVKQIRKEEVVSLDGQWKTPSVLLYTRLDLDEILDVSALPTKVDYSLLFKNLSIARKPPKSSTLEVLTLDEMPNENTIVTIDSEFVALSQEESEIRSNGTKTVIRPSTLTLARVSVLRGDGPKEQVPFIDDYIATSEPVVDYLTEFSGIKAGDLDPKTTEHILVPLKVAYKKLRMLVDLGCKFVGHGLNKDFRIINILVPQEQVIDTVDIYHIRNRFRKISLRFLAWHLLEQDIQSDGHDSIEDARTALILYRKYEEYQKAGTFGEVLEGVYDAGKKAQWLKTPKEAS